MKLKQIILPLSLLLLFLGGCGALSALGAASRDSAALQARAQQLKAQSDELDQKMDLMRQTLETYGPLAADLGPDIKKGYEELLKKYDLVSGYVREGREILDEVKSLHEQNLAKATDPESGDVDWLKYALGMLGGGGGIYELHRRNKKAQRGERDQTANERDRLHVRADVADGKVADLEGALREMMHKMEVEAALRAQPPA